MVRVEFKGVSLGYRHRAVIEDIDFGFADGEFVGLIGPNGSGKSTIIRALSKIISPLKGQILVNGRDIGQIPQEDLARVLSVVPQLPLLPSAFTALEIVLMGRNPHLGLFGRETQKDREIAWHSMEATGTADLAKRSVGELSGGQIQSVLIARALAQETEGMLLDEPTANLDIGRQIDVLNLMKQLCREKNLAVLAAVHDLNLAAQYCDRLVLIFRGAVYCQGTPSQVLTSENVGAVYGATGCVFSHPLNGLPVVLASPQSAMGQRSGAREFGG